MKRSARRWLRQRRLWRSTPSGGRIHVEWNPRCYRDTARAVAFFIDFLKVSGLFDAWVNDCPLHYHSNNASASAKYWRPSFSILAGHTRYAHITAIREDGIHPELLGVKQLVSEDAARRASKIDRSAGITWLDNTWAKPPILAVLPVDT